MMDGLCITKMESAGNKWAKTQWGCINLVTDNSDFPRAFRYYKIQKSKSDFKLYPDTHHKHQLLSSKSDVVLDETRTRDVLKTLFLEERNSRKQKPRNFSAFKTVLKEEFPIGCSKECQTEASQSAEETKQRSQKQFQEIYQTIDCLEENISSRPAPPATVDVAASALRLKQSSPAKEPRLSSKSTNRKMSLKSIGVGVNDKNVLDVAVGNNKKNGFLSNWAKVIGF